MFFPGSKTLKPQPETPTESLIIDFSAQSLCKSSPFFSQPAISRATFLSKCGRYRVAASTSPARGLGKRWH